MRPYNLKFLYEYLELSKLVLNSCYNQITNQTPN